jgi:hypothetical protein
MISKKTKIRSKSKTKSKSKSKRKYQKSRKSGHYPHYPPYPFYRNDYKLIPMKLKIISARIPSQLNIYQKPPNKQFPGYKLPIKRLDIQGSQNGYYVIRSKWDDNLELNSLTDYFTEPCRVKCTFKNRMAPLEYWQLHHKDLTAALKRQHLPETGYNYREEMYKRNKPCNNFRISVCLEVLRLFKPKSWLDISAGWGDRLLSALLSTTVATYTACDPNDCLHPYYKEMIKTFDPEQKKKITMIQDGFETAILPANQKYDLAFSSPPFFDLEIYSKTAADSLVKYNTSQKWFNGFLMPSIYKAVEYLNPDGYLVLYMGESQNTQYIPEMIRLTDNIKGVRNAGMFYYTDGAKLREFYCWCKKLPKS